MSEEKVPTVPGEEAFNILEAPLIRLVRTKTSTQLLPSIADALPYSYRGPATRPLHLNLKPRIIHWEMRCGILSCKSA